MSNQNKSIKNKSKKIKLPIQAITVFLGAFLLFQIQPLYSKYILPWFGGGSMVWTACMLFFQLLLIAGYAYSHLITRYLKPYPQVIIHIVFILTAAVFSLYIAPDENWKFSNYNNPALQILAILFANIGFPYLALSTTAPLIQSWFGHTHSKSQTYRLYSVSNIGSLFALVSYPIIFEPSLTIKNQILAWSFIFALFSVLIIYCAIKYYKSIASSQKKESAIQKNKIKKEMIPFRLKFLWIALPACSSILLLAITNQITLDISPVPFLWILPFGLYILSFIICFSSAKLYFRKWFIPAFILATISIFLTLFLDYNNFLLEVTSYSFSLFAFSMICHGELAYLKPSKHHLTSFYLLLSIGGAIGGAMVSLLAPQIFSFYLELHFGILFCYLLLWLSLTIDKKSILYRVAPKLRRVLIGITFFI